MSNETKQIINNMDFMEYRSKTDCISVSELKSFIDSPYSYYKRYILKDNDAAPKHASLQFGTLVHQLVLEPHDFDKQYMISDVRRDARTKAYQAEIEAANGRELVSTAELERAKEAAGQARPMLLEMAPKFIPELSYFYQGHRGFLGMKAKARVDAYCPCSEALIDLKTTNKLPTHDNISKAALNWGYHLQTAWYMDMYKALTGRLPSSFKFIFVQSEFPYGCQVYTMDREFIEYGRYIYKKALHELRDAIETNQFPRMKLERKTVLRLPGWVKLPVGVINKSQKEGKI